MIVLNVNTMNIALMYALNKLDRNKIITISVIDLNDECSRWIGEPSDNSNFRNSKSTNSLNL